jgi:hypothetical protein
MSCKNTTSSRASNTLRYSQKDAAHVPIPLRYALCPLSVGCRSSATTSIDPVEGSPLSPRSARPADPRTAFIVSHQRLEGPQPKDQINLTDEESRIMPVAGGGFEQCYNAQAVVAAESLLVIAVDVVQAPNDKRQIAPMLEKVDALPQQLPARNAVGRQRLFQRGECDGVHGGEHRAADCDRAAAASSLLARAVYRAASGAPSCYRFIFCQLISI